jgi:hypothetical protein
MRVAIILILAAMPVYNLVGQTVAPSGLSVRVKSASANVHGFDVAVEVKNLGGRPVILQLSPKLAGNPRLQSLTVEQWDANLGWQSVGPCRDVEGESTLKLAPQQATQDVVPIGDLAHGWANAPCPRKIQHLGGKIRAVMICTYSSVREFKQRRGIAGCQRAESPSIDLPK